MKIGAIGIALLLSLLGKATVHGSLLKAGYTGPIKNERTDLCWEIDTSWIQPKPEENWAVKSVACTGSTAQKWIYDDSTKHIANAKKTSLCVAAHSGNNRLVVIACTDAGKKFSWSHDSDGHLKNDQVPNTCVGEEADVAGKGPHPKLVACTADDIFDWGTLAVPSSAPSSTPSAAPSGSAKNKSVSAPKTGSSNGDPHFKTFGGEKFDFHGGCDLVLMDNPNYGNNYGLRVHIRTRIETWWSYIDSAVVQIGNQTLEVRGAMDGEGPQYWVNGKQGNGTAVLEDEKVTGLVKTLEASFAGFNLNYKKVNSKQHNFHIALSHQGDAISFQTFKNWVSVNVKAVKAANFVETKGLMGNYPNGDKVARDGVTVLTDVDEFGKEWQVLASEPMLFHNSEGVQPPQGCTMPDKTNSMKKRRLGEVLMTEEEASFACAHALEDERDACIFDVLATNNKEMAGAY